MKKHLLTAALVFAGGSSLWAAEPSKGLWHFTNPASGSTLAYVAVDDSGLRVWDQEWARRKVQINEQGTALDMVIDDGNKVLEMKGDLAGSTGKGTAVRPHPQFPLNLEWEARLVVPGSDWEPWNFLVSADSSVVDIFGLVVRSEERMASLAEFERFWNREVESKYYAFLTRSIYADGRGLYNDEVRRSAISSLHEAARDGSDDWLSRTERLPAEFKAAGERLRAKYPWLDLAGTVVLMPSLGQYDYRYVRLRTTFSPRPDRSPAESRHFLYVGGDWVSSHLKDHQMPRFAEQALVTLAHSTRTIALQNSLRSEIFQRGLAVLLSAQVSESSDLDSLLFQEPLSDSQRAEDFSRFRSQLTKAFNARGSDVVREFFLTDLRASSYRFAYHLLLDMRPKYSLQEMVTQFPYDKLREDVLDYLKGLKGLPGGEVSSPE